MCCLLGNATTHVAHRIHHGVHNGILQVECRQINLHLAHLLQHLLHLRSLIVAAQALRQQQVPVVRQLLLRFGAPVAPAQQVARRDEPVLAREHVAVLALRLQPLHHRHHLLREALVHAAALHDDLLQLLARQILHVHLQEAVAERARQHLAPAVLARRVLRGEQHEVGVRPHHRVRLGDEQLAVVVQQPVQRLQHLRGRQVQLIQNHPVALAQRLHQQALVEHQLPAGRRHVDARVVLQVRVLVVVDAHALVARQRRQVRDHRRLARRRGALQQHGARPHQHRATQVVQPRLHRRRQDEPRRLPVLRLGQVHGRQLALLQPVAVHLHEVLVRRAAAGVAQREVRVHLLPVEHHVEDQLAHGRLRALVQHRQEGHAQALVQRLHARQLHALRAAHEVQRAAQRAQRVMRRLVRAVHQTAARALPRPQVELHDLPRDARVAQRRVLQRAAHDQLQVPAVCQLVHVELAEAVAYRRRQRLLAHVRRRVHRREDAEVGVSADRHHVATLAQHQTARGALQQPAQPLQHLARRQVQLVQQHPLALLDRRHQRARHEREGEAALHLRHLLLERRHLRRERAQHRQPPLVLLHRLALRRRARARLLHLLAGEGAEARQLRRQRRELAAVERLLQRGLEVGVLVVQEQVVEQLAAAVEQRDRQLAQVHRLEPAHQVAALRLLVHVQHHQLLPHALRQVLDHRRLATARLAHQQHRLLVRDARRDLLHQPQALLRLEESPALRAVRRQRHRHAAHAQHARLHAERRRVLHVPVHRRHRQIPHHGQHVRHRPRATTRRQTPREHVQRLVQNQLARLLRQRVVGNARDQRVRRQPLAPLQHVAAGDRLAVACQLHLHAHQLLARDAAALRPRLQQRQHCQHRLRVPLALLVARRHAQHAVAQHHALADQRQQRREARLDHLRQVRLRRARHVHSQPVVAEEAAHGAAAAGAALTAGAEEPEVLVHLQRHAATGDRQLALLDDGKQARHDVERDLVHVLDDHPLPRGHRLRQRARLEHELARLVGAHVVADQRLRVHLVVQEQLDVVIVVRLLRQVLEQPRLATARVALQQDGLRALHVQAEVLQVLRRCGRQDEWRVRHRDRRAVRAARQDVAADGDVAL